MTFERPLPEDDPSQAPDSADSDSEPDESTENTAHDGEEPDRPRWGGF